MAMVQRILCELHLHHRWETRSTEDGTRYLRCTWCYRDGIGSWGYTINPLGSIKVR
jgi:hypothetical protein